MSDTRMSIEIPQEAWEMARRPYHISVRRDDEDACYVAEVAEFPYLTGAEDTPEAAIATLRHALALAIAGQMRHGNPIPEPQPIHA
ncbi:MAG: type II toxin-antitoxin system HicB family antitoxin [Thermomicrobiales bacterium]